MDIKQKKQNRFLFLKKIYEESNGSSEAESVMSEIGFELAFDDDQTQQIVDYLKGENLIESYGIGSSIIHLTHWGIKEVEQALEYPDKPTEHFSPINIITIGTMTNSTLQQSTHSSSINVHYDTSKLNDIETIINSLTNINDTLNISIDLHRELICEIETLVSQRKSPNPKSIIITESLKTIRTLLENVVGNALTPCIIGQITNLLNIGL